MFGSVKKNKYDVPLEIKRGDIFTVNNKQLYKDSPKISSLFFDEPSEHFWLNVNKVIVVNNDIANKHSSSIHVLPITKSLVGDVTSVDDLRAIKRIYLEEKVGEVSQSTLRKFEEYFIHENHSGIVVEY